MTNDAPSSNKCPRCGKLTIDDGAINHNEGTLVKFRQWPNCDWIEEESPVKVATVVVGEHAGCMVIISPDGKWGCLNCAHAVRDYCRDGRGAPIYFNIHCAAGKTSEDMLKVKNGDMVCTDFSQGEPQKMGWAVPSRPTLEERYWKNKAYFDSMGITLDDFLKVARGLEAYE